MDELVVDGERYISSKRAARLSGYTKDYVGQLCRAGKIPSKMVGRNWYVQESAIKAHRKEYQGEPVVDPALWEETAQGTTFKGFGASRGGPAKPRLTEEHIKITYETDNRPLIPVPKLATESKLVQPVSETSEIKPVSEPLAPMAEAPAGLQSDPRSEEAPQHVTPPIERAKSAVSSAQSAGRISAAGVAQDTDDEVVVIEPASETVLYRLFEIGLVLLILISALLVLFEQETTYRLVEQSGNIDLQGSQWGVWGIADLMQAWFDK